MVFDTDLCIGFGVLLGSFAVLHALAAIVTKSNGKTDLTEKINKVFLTAVYPVLVCGFVVAMMWVGTRAKPGPQEPGKVDTTPGQLNETVPGKNSPEEAGKRLDKELKEGQEKSMKDLDEFRKNMLDRDKKEKKGDE